MCLYTHMNMEKIWKDTYLFGNIQGCHGKIEEPNKTRKRKKKGNYKKNKSNSHTYVFLYKMYCIFAEDNAHPRFWPKLSGKENLSF